MVNFFNCCFGLALILFALLTGCSDSESGPSASANPEDTSTPGNLAGADGNGEESSDGRAKRSGMEDGASTEMDGMDTDGNLADTLQSESDATPETPDGEQVAEDSTLVDGTQPAEDAVIGERADTTDSMDASDGESPDPMVDAVEPEVDTGENRGDDKLLASSCFEGMQDPGKTPPDYDQFEGFKVGTHCKGTNHQDIFGVEKVVVLGDSITQGSPNDVHPTCIDTAHFYRNQLAEWLSNTFNLDKGNDFDWAGWKTFSCLYDGNPGKQDSGVFSNCSKWGARTDDLMGGGAQLAQCFGDYPAFGSDKKTLIYFTMGGNDIGSINKSGFEASPEEVAAGYPEAWSLAQSTVSYLDEAMAWMTNPAHFPNGVYVVFGTPYEFTDSTGNTDACDPEELKIPFTNWTLNIKDLGIDLAEIAGFGPWENQDEQFAIVRYLLEEYARIAAQYQVDMIFMAEQFCGHGWVATGDNADPNNPCYKGPDAELWFDKSCYHPSDAGHTALYELFKTVISE